MNRAVGALAITGGLPGALPQANMKDAVGVAGIMGGARVMAAGVPLVVRTAGTGKN